ncbi:MAG: prepilin-type N-terminal cleavage/methylation domain-containing protein [Cyanobacteria bacterium RM1_2_2]|nr:prepilin-type N-terminal cleavage/methylation domain-containing protein [Cyanobacteria bacterium RM1_2_2]
MRKIVGWHTYRSNCPRQKQAGLTLPEVLVVIVIAGILVAISAPSWLGLQTNSALSVSQDEVFQAIRQAQLQAINTQQSWQVRFRDTGEQLEWSVGTSASSTSHWQPLLSTARIAPDETTLKRNADGAYFVEFNDKGNVTPPFGRLSLASQRGGKQRRCVFVSTLLGVLRKASDEACYR